MSATAKYTGNSTPNSVISMTGEFIPVLPSLYETSEVWDRAATFHSHPGKDPLKPDNCLQKWQQIICSFSY